VDDSAVRTADATRGAPQADAEWLRTTIEHTSRRFGTRVAARPDDLLEVMSLRSNTHPRRTRAGVGS